jgi:hypothetical protein
MLSFHLLATTVVAVLLVIAPAFGQAPPRVRGTITAIDDGSISKTCAPGALVNADGRIGLFDFGQVGRISAGISPPG